MFSLPPAAQAAVPLGLTAQALYSQTNDRDANVDIMSALVDANGVVQAMLNVTNGQADRAEPFWMKDIEKRDGVVVLAGQGRKVLLMQGQLDRSTQEGRLHMTYLANGLTNKYETCGMLVKN